MALAAATLSLAIAAAASANPMVGGAAMYSTRKIVQNADISKDHSTLVAAVKAGGLVDTLSGAGPFTVFARGGRSFVRSTLPLLGGMAATFAIVATLAAVGGGWAVRANAVGRWAALLLLALFGIALVFPSVSDRLTRPLVALGSRLTEQQGQKESIWSSLVLGVATGLLWAPCAGPILGIIFTAAAIQGASFSTTLLLLA
jgi:cytochrome c biogenesis protein CcdA